MRFFVLAGLLSCAQPEAPKPEPRPEPPKPMPTTSGWTTIARDAGVIVAVEHVLYETAGDPHFFVRVRIESARGVAVDLRNYHEVFYPNQWGASETPQRTEINERRRVLPPFDPAPVLADHAAGTLTPIAAGGTLDYYEEFNASGRADVDAQTRGAVFVIVTMDGQLRVSDGKTAERLAPSSDAAREVAIPTPVVWKSIPAGARTIRSH